MLKLNPNLKLILADVDETIADVYTDATPEIIAELSKLLTQGKVLFLVSGGGYQSIFDRVISKFAKELRHKVLLAHCSGAEVIGFDVAGEELPQPHYSLYDRAMTSEQKLKWREIMLDITTKFNLVKFSACPVKEFKQKAGENPLAVIYADRGPQITMEFVNAFDLTPTQLNELGLKLEDFPAGKTNLDMRDIILPYARQKFLEAGIPVEIDYGGTFAMDFKLHGVNKTLAVKFILENKHILHSIGLDISNIDHPEELEIWGDKFSVINGGSDRYMCFAVAKEVRSIDFRQEESSEFPEGYNIVIWEGSKHLHEGTLEYLQLSRLENN